MTSPLAQHLTQFDRQHPRLSMIEVVELEPEICAEQIALSPTDLEEQLEAAREQVRAEAAAEIEQLLSQSEAERIAAVEGAVAAARAEWATDHASAIASSCEAAFAELRELVCERLANVLRPLLADVVVRHAVAELAGVVDRLRADPSCPAIKIRGPFDLVTALEAARPEIAGVATETCDTMDITVTAAGSHVETQIAAAFAALLTETPT